MREDTREILERLVQAGIVHAVDNEKHMARVKFPLTGIMSDWLYVLDTRPFIPEYDGPQETEEEAGGTGDPAFAAHKHSLVIRQWMPKVNDLVVCLFLPVWNADGFIIGRIDR